MQLVWLRGLGYVVAFLSRDVISVSRGGGGGTLSIYAYNERSCWIGSNTDLLILYIILLILVLVYRPKLA